jgi:8-oxo-dGTP pyrophosphatase MutT (NUDIX family)
MTVAASALQTLSLESLQAALHPLDAAPAGRGWNQDELDGLLPADTALVDAAVLVPLVQRAALDDTDAADPHFDSTSLAVVLTRRTDDLRHHAGQVSFPGGRVDANDAGPVDAALREAHEEIGLPPAQAQLLGYLDPLATVTGFRVLPVVARIPADFVPRPEPSEVAEVFEVPLAWLMAPENLARIAIEFGGRARHVLEFRRHDASPGQRIWGVTASILFNLRERLAEVQP